jgi:hypothetical protein
MSKKFHISHLSIHYLYAPKLRIACALICAGKKYGNRSAGRGRHAIHFPLIRGGAREAQSPLGQALTCLALALPGIHHNPIGYQGAWA